MARKCRSCGAKLNAQAAWCSVCGARAYSRVASATILIVALALILIAAALLWAIWTWRR